MPVKGSRSTKNNPAAMAETILDLLDQVPGARSVFLHFTPRSQTLKLVTGLVNDPECDRWRASKGYFEVGTYARGAAQTDVIADLIETQSRIR